MSDQSPAETLRKAAVLMRVRAEKAGGGKWEYRDTWVWDGLSEIADIYGPDMDEIGTYIASMNPLVALALADWLDSQARDAADAYELPGGEWRFSQCDSPSGIESALEIARLYLGEVSDV